MFRHIKRLLILTYDTGMVKGFDKGSGNTHLRQRAEHLSQWFTKNTA